MFLLNCFVHVHKLASVKIKVIAFDIEDVKQRILSVTFKVSRYHVIQQCVRILS